MGATAEGTPENSSDSTGVHIAEGFGFKALSGAVRGVEQNQSLHFAGGIDRMEAHPHAFKGQPQASWARALGVLTDAHREAMKPLPGFADNVEDAGTAYHGTDGDNASGISSVI